VGDDDRRTVRTSPTNPVRRLSSVRDAGRVGLLIGAALILALQGPGVALGDHGGRELGSFGACDRPVNPPRCTSVGNNVRHYVAFDPSLTAELAEAMRFAMERVYEPTRLVMVEQAAVSPLTDVIAFSADYGENGAAGWVYCPSDRSYGVNGQGHRWCQGQELHLNLNPRYGVFFGDDASRRHVACHELGHTLGLLHWGNPPETDGPVGATCMNANTPNGPIGLHSTDVDHINAYSAYLRRPQRGVRIVRAPAADVIAVEPVGALSGASQVENPRTLAELVAIADAVVRGRVVAVERGRVFGSSSYALHYAAATVRVDEALAGTVAGAPTLTLEIPLFDGADSLGTLRAQMLGSDRILFLRNKGTSAREAGRSIDEQRAESAYFRLVTFGSEVIDLGGRASVPPDDGRALSGLSGRAFDDVVATVRAAVR
jgi:hypothetical protein